MTIWVYTNLSPAIAAWIRTNFEIEAFSLRELGLRDAEDEEILR